MALRQKAANTLGVKGAMKVAADAVSAAFATLTDHETAATLRAQGIAPESLIPPEFIESPIEKVANVWKHQHPRLVAAGTRR